MARTELTADTVFYCSPSGSDSNDGLTISTPKLTTNAMIAVIQKNYDIRGFDVCIQHADGNYPSIYVQGQFVGDVTPLRIVGSITRGACKINSVGPHGVWADGGARILVEGFSIQIADSGLAAQFGSLIFYRDIEFLA